MKKLIPVIALLLLPSLAFATSATFQVGNTLDDGYVTYPFAGGVITTTGASVPQGFDGSNHQSAFYRFTNVTIPVGATITNAVITFTPSATLSNITANLKLFLNNVDDSAHPTTYNGYWALATTTGVAWNSVPTWTLNTPINSPDISTILQTVVNRAGWASGNAVTILVEDNGSTGSASRNQWDFDTQPTEAAQLVVTYTTPTPSTSVTHTKILTGKFRVVAGKLKAL